jgi:hypothetical protein
MAIWMAPSVAANAGVINEIARDFKPISGYVVMSSEGEYIVDLDDTKGILTGDIFSVSKSGKKIVHPVTGKVLGKLEEIKGVLKVVRIKSGYSFARSLGKAEEIKKGDPIHRYDNLKAYFWDYTGSGRNFFSQLQSTLPALKWQDYDMAQSSKPKRLSASAKIDSSLVFILTRDGVEVRGPDSYTIHTYNLPEYLSAEAPTNAAKKNTAKTTVTPAPVFAKQTPMTPQKVANKTTLFKPDFKNAKTIDTIPGFSVMADFIKIENKLLMASTDGTTIEIYQVDDKLTPLAKGLTPSPGQILALKWWQPDDKGPLYLTVASWSGKAVNGTIFQLKDQRLIQRADRISRILGAFDLDADGRPETLLGQRFDAENFFGLGIKELKMVNGKIKNFKSTLSFPKRFTVLGSLFAAVTGDGELETIFIRNGILYIYSGRQRMYASSKQMGSSLSFLTYDIDPSFKSLQTTSAAFEVSPVVADIDNDGQLEIIAIASEKDFLGDVAVARGIKKSWLEVFKYKDRTVVTGTLGDEMDTPLQGLEIDGRRVLFVATKSGNILGREHSSQLLSYWLDL